MQYVILLIPESVLNLRVWIHAVMLNFGFGHRSTHGVKNRVGLGGCARIYDTPSRPTRFRRSPVRSVDASVSQTEN